MVQSCCGKDRNNCSALSRLFAVARRISAVHGRESMSGIQYTVATELDEIIGWVERDPTLSMSVRSILEYFNYKFPCDIHWK